MADYDWFDHTEREPHPAEIEAAKWRVQGFDAKFSYGSFYNVTGVEYYRCRRGCGTLVWNPEDHMKNVCTKFEPVVGG